MLNCDHGNHGSHDAHDDGVGDVCCDGNDADLYLNKTSLQKIDEN